MIFPTTLINHDSGNFQSQQLKCEIKKSCRKLKEIFTLILDLKKSLQFVTRDTLLYSLGYPGYLEEKSKNNYLDIGLFEASTICKAIQFLMLSGISRMSKNKSKEKKKINSAMVNFISKLARKCLDILIYILVCT